MKIFSDHFTARKLLSKGALLNLALSDRSDGKTWDMKFRKLEDFYKQGLIGTVVRRYKTEIDEKFYAHFFDEVLLKANEDITGKTDEQLAMLDEIRQWQFKYSKKKIEIKRPNSDSWELICFLLPLTMSGKQKSAFNDYYTRIKYVDFDEYVPLDSRYCPNEVTLLLELYKSIDRDREQLQMIMLGNKIDIFCPLLDYFGIDLDITNAKTRVYRNGTFAVQIYASTEHREKRQQGRFASLISNTDYEDYANGGILHTLNLYTASIDNAKYVCSFMTEQGEGSIWYEDSYIISTQKRKDGYVITDKLYNTGRQEYIVTYGKFASMFKTAYRSGRMKFESNNAFHLFENILKKCGQVDSK